MPKPGTVIYDKKHSLDQAALQGGSHFSRASARHQRKAGGMRRHHMNEKLIFAQRKYRRVAATESTRWQANLAFKFEELQSEIEQTDLDTSSRKDAHKLSSTTQNGAEGASTEIGFQFWLSGSPPNLVLG